MTAAKSIFGEKINCEENELIEAALQSVIERGNFEMGARGKIGIATYEEVIDTLRDPERLLIDVRESSEVTASGQIPTSINIPLENIYSELRLSAPAFSAKYMRNKPGIYDEVIFYCKFGDQAQLAAQTAIDLGFRNVKNYRNGWSEWSYKWVEWDEWVDPEKVKQQEQYKLDK